MIILLAAMVALGATISPALNGCSGDYDAGQRYAQAGASDAHRWGDNTSSDELSRFNALFKTYASDPGNTRQLKHFRDATSASGPLMSTIFPNSG